MKARTSSEGSSSDSKPDMQLLPLPEAARCTSIESPAGSSDSTRAMTRTPVTPASSPEPMNYVFPPTSVVWS